VSRFYAFRDEHFSVAFVVAAAALEVPCPLKIAL
jgi:hypothetical protein